MGKPADNTEQSKAVGQSRLAIVSLHPWRIPEAWRRLMQLGEGNAPAGASPATYRSDTELDERTGGAGKVGRTHAPSPTDWLGRDHPAYSYRASYTHIGDANRYYGETPSYAESLPALGLGASFE